MTTPSCISSKIINHRNILISRLTSTVSNVPSTITTVSSMLLLLLFLTTCSQFTSADDHSHSYQDGEEVTFWFNKIGPYHNPQETYSYYSLPFCRPSSKQTLVEAENSLGVMLEGDELTDSGLLVEFKKPQTNTKICDLDLSSQDTIDVFIDAVKNHYWYQMYIDELPIWAMLGEYMMTEEPVLATSPTDSSSDSDSSDKRIKEQGFIYTHKTFSISYNQHQIIQVNLTSETPLPLIKDAVHALTFSVQWIPTTDDFSSRFNRYLDFDFFEHQIHWFSIFNSFMMVIFLCGLVSLILMRTLKSDYQRYSTHEASDGSSLDEINSLIELDRVIDESGWKQISRDVFRAPRYLILFAAFVGTGYQLLWLSVFAISLTCVASMYDERGSLMTLFLISYSLTSLIAGYQSAKLYKQYAGHHWKQCMAVTACMYPAFCCCIALCLNMIALSGGSTTILSYYSLTLIILIWLGITCPLILVGTLIGRSMTQANDFPCRVNTLKKPIPTRTWYTRPLTMSLFAGILPFGSIFIEMYFIFTSFWNYKFYYVYGFMFLVFIILMIVTVCVTIVSIYILLNSEDYRWHWTSFQCGSSFSIYVFLYACYYFETKTKMQGMIQTSYYFGYTAMFCAGLFFLGGSIGYTGANLFVRKIYQYIKSD